MCGSGKRPVRRGAGGPRSGRMALVKLLAACALVTGCAFGGLHALDGAIAQQARQNAGDPTETLGDSEAYGGSSRPDDWNLVLANPWNALPAGYDVRLARLSNGQAVDERCYPDLQAMMDDCRAEGLDPLICSSFRTQEQQQRLFDEQVQALAAQGLSEYEARAKAAMSVALPGTSEHQLGLALDIVDSRNQMLDESQESMPVQQWLIANSWTYGFVLRYPSDKSETTGIVYEPWHYRYVGRDAAREMHERGLCLEEYRDLVATGS